MGAMILAAVLLAKDGEVQGRVVKVEETKLDGGGVKIVVVLRTERGEVRLHVPFGRTEEGWGIDPKLAAQARELEPGALIAIGYWEGDGVKIIKWIERLKDEAKEEANRKREEEERNRDEEAMRREKEGDKKPSDKEREAQKRKEEEKRREADKRSDKERKEAEARERDQKMRGIVKQIRRERNGEGDVVKVAVILKVEKKEYVFWVPYRKVEGRWMIDKEILRKVDSLREGWDVTIGFYIAEEARFIKWIEVNQEGGDEEREPEKKEGEKDRK
jgi:hypothetical protein